MEDELIKQIIFLVAILIGQVLTVYIPYRNKRIQDGRPFDMNYVYSMFVGFAVLAVGSMNSDLIMTMPLTLTTVMLLMFGAGAVQRNIINPVTPQKG